MSEQKEEMTGLYATKRVSDGQIPSKMDPLEKNPRSKRANKALLARRSKEKNRRKVNQMTLRHSGK